MKSVAGTLAEIHNDSRIATIRNLSNSDDVMRLAAEAKAAWAYDLYTRKPGPAYTEDRVFVGTDLDLACFLSALIDRKAVINLPTYKSRRASKKRDNERVISESNRHGRVTGLISNKSVFSFSLQVLDMNVAVTNEDGSESVGAPRNFMLQDLDGKWHDGWRTIEFHPSSDENDFLNSRDLWSGHTVVFHNFIHPNRWVAFYGKNYFLLKALIARLELERKYLADSIKELEEAGVKWPKTYNTGSGALAKRTYSPSSEEEEGVSIEVEAFEAEVDFGDWENEFPKIPKKPAAMKDADIRCRLIQYELLPVLRFYARTVEYAFYKKVKAEVAAGSYLEPESFPSWISGAEWERDFRFHGKRTLWNRLVLGQPAPGELGTALRYRLFTKKEKVARV